MSERTVFSLPLIGFSLAAIFPAIVWSIPMRVSSGLVPAAVGFVTSIASLGAATFPTLIGWIASRAGLESIPATMVPLAAIMVALHFWIVRRVESRKSVETLQCNVCTSRSASIPSASLRTGLLAYMTGN
jgi:fucose permease